MREYTSCFIGVPLPKKYQAEFERLVAGVGKLYPNWEITYPKTPHTTVYYLDKQAQYVLPAIANIVQTKIRILKNLVLVVNNFDYFSKKDSRDSILFLNIVYPSAFVDFNLGITNKLSKYYSADNNLSFHPHMTVARIKGINNILSMKHYISNIKCNIDKINWEFPITEIVLYGVDSTKKPQHQEKLIHIPVK